MRHLDASRGHRTGLHKLCAEQGGKIDGTWTDVFGEGDAAAEAFTYSVYYPGRQALLGLRATFLRYSRAPGFITGRPIW